MRILKILAIAFALAGVCSTANASSAFYQPTANVAALQAYGMASTSVAHANVKCYSATGSCLGGGNFDWEAPSATLNNSCTSDGGIVILATGVPGATGCWVRNIGDHPWNVSVAWFGAVPDNSTDNTTAFNNAVTAARAFHIPALYIPAANSSYITGTVQMTGLSLMALGASVRGLPSQDVFYWKGQLEAGWVAAPRGMYIYVSQILIDQTADATATFNRWDAGGDKIGNCGIVFAGSNAAPTGHLIPYVSINANVDYLTGADNRQCAVYSQDGNVAYGAHVIHLGAQSISYGWMDGIVDAYAATANHLTGYLTATGNDFTTNTRVGIACDGNNVDASGTTNPVGNYTTCPAGLTPRQPGYYPINIGGAGAGTFQLSLTVGGAAVPFTGDGANFGVAPILASANNGGASASQKFDDVSISAISRVGMEFETQSQQLIAKLDNHSRTWVRYYNWGNSGQPSGNSNVKILQAYAEGPTNGVNGDEYMHFEGGLFDICCLTLTPTNGATSMYTTIATTNKSSYIFDAISTATGRINIGGNGNAVTVRSTAATNNINDIGTNNSVYFTGLALNAPYSSWAGSKTLLGTEGGINNDWLRRTPTTGSYPSNRNGFVPGEELRPNGVASGNFSVTSDTTGLINGALVLPIALGAVALWGSKGNTTPLLVGTDVPAGKGIAYISMRADAAVTDTFNISSSPGGITSPAGATTCNLTTSYPAVPCAVQYDATGAGAGAQVWFSIGAPSVATQRYVNYVDIEPDFDNVRGSTASLTKQYTFATLPTCNTANAGMQAYYTDGAAAPAYYAAAAGGGTVKQRTLCNGTQWIND